MLLGAFLLTASADALPVPDEPARPGRNPSYFAEPGSLAGADLPSGASTTSAYSIAPEMEPNVRTVRPVGQGALKGTRWGFLAGAGAGTAVAAVLSSRRESDRTQLYSAIGTWVSSIMVGFLIGHCFDPVAYQTAYPPRMNLTSRFVDADGNGVLSGDEEGRLQISIGNCGRGRAKNVRLGVELLESGVPVTSEYRGPTQLGSIDCASDRQITVMVRPQTELPRNRFAVGITCSYETEWGAEGTETHKVIFTSAPRGAQ